MKRTIRIELRVASDADERALERALEALITDSSVGDMLLEGESFELLDTTIDVGEADPSEPVEAEHEPDSERTQLADHLMQEAKDRRERGE